MAMILALARLFGSEGDYTDATEACFGTESVEWLAFLLFIGSLVALMTVTGVGYLAWFHIYLRCKHMTTWDYIQMKRRQHATEEELIPPANNIQLP
jgi:hypothetical protein